MIGQKWYKKTQQFISRNKARDKEIKERGVIIYNVFDNFSFHQFFVKTAESKIFEFIIMFIIVANTICCTFSAEYAVKHNGEDLDVLNVLEIFFVTAYSVEFFIKFVAFPLKYWFSLWNLFDFFVLVISYLPFAGKLANYSFLRVVRAIRLLRLIRSWEELNVILSSLFKAFVSSFFLIIMLILFILIIAITALYLFGHKVADPWGSLETSILNIFAFATADAWGVYQDDLDEAFGEVSRIFSVVVILFLGTIFTQGLLVASVTDGFSESSSAFRKKKSKELTKENKKYSDKVKDVERQKKKQEFIKAKEDAINYCDIFDDDEDGIENHLKDKGDIDPQQDIFENPQWMNSLKLILHELKKDNKRKKKLYNELFLKILQMSDFTNTPNVKIELDDNINADSEKK